MNTRAKGERIKNKCTEYLMQVYYIHNNPHLRYGTKTNYNNKVNKDIFGLFDGIAVSKADHNLVYFVQYSANKFHSIKPYITWVKKTGTSVMLLCIKDRIDNIYIKIIDIDYPKVDKGINIHNYIIPLF